jgi:hypothetical protein
MTLALYQVLCTQYVVRAVQSLRAPHSALRTSPSALRALLLLLALVTGCSPTNVSSEVYEPSLDEQLRSVLSGQSDEIVSAAALADDDLAVIEKATALRILIVENQESRITARGIQSLANLPNLEHLRLRGPGVDDAALAEIAKLTSLQILNTPRGEFTDAGLQQLKSLPNLVQLRFGSPHVTDAGMKTLVELPALRRLHLIDVPITDAGLHVLATIDQLESLYIDGAAVSDASYDELFRLRPGLHVHINQQHHDRDPHSHAH